jgi:hypothetical protein
MNDDIFSVSRSLFVKKKLFQAYAETMVPEDEPDPVIDGPIVDGVFVSGWC